MVDLRTEYPRPQFVRKDWLNLNGEWDFEIDNAEMGMERKFFERETLDRKITVPYCPESKLSGIGETGFMDCVWYRKNIEIPENWNGKQILLHFGAVDYIAHVYVNGVKVGTHTGGYSSFKFDITSALKEKDNYITLCAVDHLRDNEQPSGKQSKRLESYGCLYTRTTGIWQTVWLEPVDKKHIESYKCYPDIHNGEVQLRVILPNYAQGCKIRAVASYMGREMGSAETEVISNECGLTIKLAETHLWEIGQGRLYDLTLTLSDGETVTDEVESYFGMREVGLTKRGMTLNGKYVFGRWVLDQGFYPDGIYTAPSDEALKNDILYSMQLGFNGARLHQKIFEERFLYWADKLGYPVWEEHANWGLDITKYEAVAHFLPEWIEAMERDFNHPAIIGWCPLNETWLNQDERFVSTVYCVTKALDKTRPVIDTSGYFHVVADVDIYDVHDYEQNPEIFAKGYEKLSEGIFDNDNYRKYPDRFKYDKEQPFFVSEYGGIKWDTESVGEGWGYGESVTSGEAFIARYKGLTDALLDNPNVMGFCYTQLYDVEQEVNGLMTYDRRFKFDPEIFRKINERKAAME